MNARRAVPALALALLPAFAGVPASPLAAQQFAGDCQLMDTFRSIQSREVSPGVSIVWISRPDLRCPNGVRIRSDSAVVYEAQGRNELIGNVRFTTAERDLTARDADWFDREGRLFARGNVVFTDLTEGTEIRGDTLVYLEARGAREEQLTVDGTRPSAVLPVEAAPGAPPAEPYRIQASRLRFQGDQFFWGDGDVEVLRGETRASADSVAYDRTVGTLILNRDAMVVRDDVIATGGTLNLGFADDRLTSVLARRGGRIVTDDITLAGLQVEVTLDENEEVSSVLAEGGEDPETGQRFDATLEAENLFLRGSRQVEIQDDSDGNRVLVATGNARAESLGDGFGSVADEAARPGGEPAEADTVPGLNGVPDRDWVEGEEIVALLERVPPGERLPAPDAADAPTPEPADAETARDNGATFRLVRLTSTNNARALYRSPPEETNGTAEPVAEPDAPEEAPGPPERRLWSISYILADLIIIHLQEGEVRLLEAEGNVTGLQLEPGGGGSG
jgi:hypothetical protein